MKNRKIRTATEKAYILFAALIAVAGLVAISSYAGKAVVKAIEVPTVYMVHGDKDVCVKATNAQGKAIPCAEAMKGTYHIEWNPSKTLNEN